MKKILLPLIAVMLFSCHQEPAAHTPVSSGNAIDTLFQKYFDERMRLYPLEATQNGIYTYNDKLPIDISESYRDTLRAFYSKYQNALQQFDRGALDPGRQISYDVLQWELNINLEGLTFPDNLMPIQQFWGLPLTMGQLGSGSSTQPFRSVQDYENFLRRMDAFGVWCDTAIANMKKGLAMHITPPRILMQRVLPEMQGLIASVPDSSIFYKPVLHMPDSISATDKDQLAYLYRIEIQDVIDPAYQKLYNFIKNDYIPHLRQTAGISEIPNGDAYYRHLVKLWTTTDLTPDSIYALGMEEVTRIHREMENVLQDVHFKGSLKDFFTYVHTNPQFFPFHTDAEVLDAYKAIEAKEKPHLPQLFNVFPKTPLEIRQTEAFRAASASAEYNPGTPDGSRPGIFYVPILDPEKYNDISMEDLFLHEAIPGHHYQISLQQEDTLLPDFRKFIWYGAYGEGWALYAESLGKALGLYQDPYQYFGSLSEEMHRAIRLVVDVGMHEKGWTREQAIQFSLDNEAESEADITSEIERYMAIPGQALSYKIGQLTILSLRAQAMDALGRNFNIADFHDAVLHEGCLPLTVFETYMQGWTEAQKK